MKGIFFSITQLKANFNPNFGFGYQTNISNVLPHLRQIDRHREYFMEKGINPFREAHEILLSFLDNFDKVAGMKAK